MALREELEKQGGWLFRWRNYLPLLMLPILLMALRDSGDFERVFGDTADTFFGGFCIVVSFLGLVIRSMTIGHVPKGTSGRNTRTQKAETLNTTGIYSVVRHPLYFGNFVIFLGIVLYVRVWWFGLIAISAFWLYYERIMFKEEEFLRKKFGESYLEWSEKTPAFLPRFKHWQPPSLSFSFRNVLKREYSGFFGIVASFTFLAILQALFKEGKFEFESGWVLFFLIGLGIYLTLRMLKKKTKIFHVEGR